MSTTRWLRLIPGILAAASLVATVVVSAQGNRITIQLMPKPNQVVRYHTVQEVRFALPSPGAPADPSPAPAGSGAIVVATESVHTLAVGAPDAQGHAEARFTYDQLTMQINLNGQPMPLPLPIETIVRQPFTAVLDRDGRMIDIKGTDENAGLMSTIKPLLASALSGPSSMTLAPGETTTVPLSADLALPLPGANASPMALTGEMKYTLVSVEGGNAERVAHMTTTMTGHIVAQEIQTPAGTMRMAMMMTGDGTLDVNADRGIVTLRKQRQMIDIQIEPGAAAGAALPPMKMSGTITLTVSAE